MRPRGMRRDGLNEWCRSHRHDPVKLQHQMLRAKMLGHYNYYGRSGNFRSVAAFAREVERIWQRWLSRRSQRALLSWERFKRHLRNYPLPKPRLPRSVTGR